MAITRTMGVEPASSRDREWFSRLYHDNYRMLMAFARRRIDEQTADEVVADTFLVAWRRREDLPEGFERAWLFGVARNTMLSAARASRRRNALSGKLRGVARPDWSDGWSEVGDRADALLQAMRELREEDREVLLLLAWEEMSHAEIAHTMGITANAVAIRICRARKRLADRIDKLACHDED